MIGQTRQWNSRSVVDGVGERVTLHRLKDAGAGDPSAKPSRTPILGDLSLCTIAIWDEVPWALRSTEQDVAEIGGKRNRIYDTCISVLQELIRW